jgi:hypothetical protein
MHIDRDYIVRSDLDPGSVDVHNFFITPLGTRWGCASEAKVETPRPEIQEENGGDGDSGEGS